MTEAASTFLAKMAQDYQAAGYPHPNTWARQPESPEQERVFNELKARGIFRQRTMEACALTEDGLSLILRQLPPSPEANALFQRLREQYIAAGFPNRKNWAFGPDSEDEEKVYNELQARGYLEKRNIAMWVLSAAAHAEIMEST